ncbi:MAG: hypothetical protein LBI45_01760 [Bacteroidales bacterium]|jgi:hypothetical protein|nr:hypothetical protein [Bacteroidales bacterium]
MKKLTILFLTILLAGIFSLQAQKQFAGEIRFEAELEGTDDPNLIAGFESMTQTTTILGNKSKSVMKPNEMVAITQIWDGDKGTSSAVIEISGMGKYYKKWDAEQHKEKFKFNDFKYSFESEFKTICDLKCQKVVATITNMEDDSQEIFTLYVAKEIGTSKINGDQFVGLEGFPLMIIQHLPDYGDECVMIMQATKMTPKKVKDVDFLLPSDAKSVEDDPAIKEMLKGAFGD